MVSMSYFGFQPHCARASESSRDLGHESAIACLKSGLYVILKPGTCLAIAAASCAGVKRS